MHLALVLAALLLAGCSNSSSNAPTINAPVASQPSAPDSCPLGRHDDDTCIAASDER